MKTDAFFEMMLYFHIEKTKLSLQATARNSIIIVVSLKHL